MAKSKVIDADVRRLLKSLKEALEIIAIIPERYKTREVKSKLTELLLALRKLT